jgi:hypothetical protein
MMFTCLQSEDDVVLKLCRHAMPFAALSDKLDVSAPTKWPFLSVSEARLRLPIHFQKMSSSCLNLIGTSS